MHIVMTGTAALCLLAAAGTSSMLWARDAIIAMPAIAACHGKIWEVSEDYAQMDAMVMCIVMTQLDGSTTNANTHIRKHYIPY